jgi:hypothetical protein
MTNHTQARRSESTWMGVAALCAAIIAAACAPAPPASENAPATAGEIRPASAGGMSTILSYHPYDPSAPERLPALAPGLGQWEAQDLESELRARAGFELSRCELDVCYYRIGYTIAFPLPLTVSPRMADLPVGISGITYPWYTWLGWSLEERWRSLHAAWRRLGNRNAGTVLQRELAALAGWEQSSEKPGSASLATAHIAGCLAQALSDKEGWDPGLYDKTRSAAAAILERDVRPWFDREWPEGREIGERELQNIRVITLARSAELARVVDSPLTTALGARTRQALRAWYRLRLAVPPYNEGNSYDGFLLDSLTGWLSGEPDREALLAEGRDALTSQASQWIRLTLPGRLDAQAPIGDVEPEMPFWMTALHRLALWNDRPEAAWLVRRLPPAAMPAALLAEALEHDGSDRGEESPPKPGSAEHPHAISLRTGWGVPDILAAVGLTRTEVGHLHTDAGQLVLGWQGRFWITDPGYQQYRSGAEREFSIGVEAHNIPVIAGRAPAKRAPRLSALSELPDGGWQAVIDLSACYEGLPAGATVEREIRLLPGAKPAVVVRDRLKNVGPGTEVRTFWQGGTQLGWAFREGWARLSDGGHALWIGVYPGNIPAAALDRHESSRGPLTLHDATTLSDGNGDRYWVFAGDDADGWTPPADKFRALIRDWGE